jgi:hypothetical protein
MTKYHHRTLVFCLTGVFLLAGMRTSLGQETGTGTIRGIVQDNKGEPLVGAHVALKGTRLGAATNPAGQFTIAKLQPGLYTVEATFMGFAKVTRQVAVRSGEATIVDFLLEESSFSIGGMEVVGSIDLIPREAQTKTTISSAEIEHAQASSIGEVLDLVPGVQKTENPGIGKTSQVALRGDVNDGLSGFGTLVMIDGIPLSNNANLQFEKYVSGAAGGTTTGRGTDLRMIPADNVQSIEVVSGIPSVRYGDVTAGVINVQTKTGIQPHRLKIKSNPDTREANLGGGFNLFSSGFSYNFNAARSERDIRLTGDEFVRLTGQLVMNRSMMDDALSLNVKVSGQKMLDDQEPRGDLWKTHNYNHGYTFGLASWGKYDFVPGVSSLEFNTYATLRREDTYRSKLIQGDIRILPNGDTVSSYIGKLENRGNEWTVGGRLEWNNTFFTGNLIHRSVVGTDLQYNANTGEGLMLDTLYNYYGSTSGRLPYSYDSIPGQLLASVYVEDQITGHVGVDFSLTAGLRYEMYRPCGFDIKGLWGAADLVKSHQGAYLNPRMTLLLSLSREDQIRLSAGFSSKSPPMSSIYVPPDAYRWRNPVTATVVYLRPDRWSPDLKGYREGQVELAYDRKLFHTFGLSLSGYYRKRTNEPEEQEIPVFATTTLNGKETVYYINKYSRFLNLGLTDSKGIEFTLRTSQIKPLNMDFRIVGFYSYVKTSRRGTSFDATPDASVGRYPNYHVPGVASDTLIGYLYPPPGKWKDWLLVNYYVRYIHPSLGLWITFRAEQLVFDRYQDIFAEPVDFALLTEPLLLNQRWRESVHSKYVKWLLNLNISKSLFKGAEISFYVNNFLDDPAITRSMTSATEYVDSRRNPPLFYGIEFSMVMDAIFGKGE